MAERVGDFGHLGGIRFVGVFVGLCGRGAREPRDGGHVAVAVVFVGGLARARVRAGEQKPGACLAFEAGRLFDRASETGCFAGWVVFCVERDLALVGAWFGDGRAFHVAFFQRVAEFVSAAVRHGLLGDQATAVGSFQVLVAPRVRDRGHVPFAVVFVFGRPARRVGRGFQKAFFVVGVFQRTPGVVFDFRDVMLELL